MGSNPIPSIDSSVRRKSKQESKHEVDSFPQGSSHPYYFNMRSEKHSLPRERHLRDVYNRKEKLKHCIERINRDLEGSDREQVNSFIEHMQDKERSILWIVSCTTVFLQMRKQFGKSFSQITKDDVRALFAWMNEKGYKATTHEKFRVILKMFFKFTFGNNKYYPEQVDWFSVTPGKERFRYEKRLDIAEFLDEEEIQILIKSADSLQYKAFIACMYETGARPEEFLVLTNKDFQIKTNGIEFILRGKTGERRVLIITFAEYFKIG